MSNILLKVQQYLDNVSKNPVKLDKQLVQEFGEACKSALLKQFEETRRDKFEVRMSNIGRPLCQLQMEAKGIKGEGQPYNVKMRNTFGDIIEALAIFVMKSSGIKVSNEQKKVNYKFNGDNIEGRQDVRLMEKYGILKVHHHIPLKKNLERLEDLMKLSEKIPLVMRHKDFYMGKVKVKSLVDG